MTAAKSLLVAVDYSDTSLVAYRRAIELAARFDARIDLVHFWSAPFFESGYDTGGADGQSLFELVRGRAREEMATFVGKVGAPANVEVTTRVESGDASRGVAAIAEQEKPELIIVGTHGRTGVPRWFLGSVAERLVQLAPRPVLTVSPEKPDKPRSLSKVEKIVVPVDLSEASKSALRYALVLAETFGARVEALHVVAPPPYVPLDMMVYGPAQDRHISEVSAEMGRLVADTVRSSSVQVAHRCESGIPYEVIAAEGEEADLVVMGTQGRTGLPHLLLGSVAERVVRTVATPVITVSPRVT